MSSVVFESVTKTFRHQPALFNWIGREHGGLTHALNHISFAAESGKVLVLLGPNGSGKTTLLKIIAGILLPNEGRILLSGTDTQHQPGLICRTVSFAVANERSFFPRLTARENLDFFAALENIPRHQRAERIEFVLRKTGLEADGDTLVMKFSSGMYQRLAISRALLKHPPILLLDEPTRSLDPGAAVHFWRMVRESAAEGTTVLLATHNFEEAVAVADAIAILRAGTLIAQRNLQQPWDVEELRSFYFSETAQAAAPDDALARGAW